MEYDVLARSLAISSSPESGDGGVGSLGGDSGEGSRSGDDSGLGSVASATAVFYN